MIVHVVTFKWSVGTTEDALDALSRALDGFASQVPELRDYRHGSDLGLRAGNADYAVAAVLDRPEDVHVYLDHPEHVRIGDTIPRSGRRHPRRVVTGRGRIRPVRHPVGADRRPARGWRNRHRGGLQQLRCRGVGAGAAAGRSPDPADGFLLRRGNKEFARQYLCGELEVELTPQGPLAERMRAGGSGIPAFFTATGVGTQVADGGLPWRYDSTGAVTVASPPKEVRSFPTAEGEKKFVLEHAIVADFGLVRAWKGDRHGNLVYRRSARSFNPLAAMCGRITIAEVEELVEPGALDPDAIHTPGVFVQRVVALSSEEAAEKRIEKRTVYPPADAGAPDAMRRS